SDLPLSSCASSSAVVRPRYEAAVEKSPKCPGGPPRGPKKSGSSPDSMRCLSSSPCSFVSCPAATAASIRLSSAFLRAAVGALGDDLTTVRFRDLPDDREPQPGSGHAPSGAGPVEPVEDVRQVLLVDPGAVVAHRHLAAADRDLDLAARRAPLGRVVEQVRDRALDRRGDAVDDRLLEVGRERDAGPVATRRLRAGSAPGSTPRALPASC